MLKFIVKALGLIACLALSGVACAVGMGGINVATALGEPLKAEIELVAIGKAEKGSISARLASPEIFKGAGMEYPSGLSALKFQVETRANGESYIRVTSAQPVNEPFVSLLVELSWPSGKLLREYTFLLDPPGYKAEQPKMVEIKPVAPSIAVAPVAPSVAPAPKAVVTPSVTTPSTRTPAPKEEKVHAVAAVPDKKPAGSSNVASGAITVKRGDTLSEIAIQAKPTDVSLERMLVALYRANTDAFDDNNMNRLKTGKILQMPENRDLDKLTQVDAIKEIRVQVADWHAYRQKLASASVAATEHAPRQEASGKISTTVADKAPAAKESAKEVVKLSKGEAPGDKAATSGNVKALQDKVHALEEEAIARNKALKESNERIALLEKNIKEMQRLIELKGQPVVPAKPVLSKADALAETKPAPKPEPAKVEAKLPTPVSAVAPAVAAASTVAPASAVPQAKPAAKKPVTAPKVVSPPPSLLDDPLYLVGGAALLALGGIGFMLARRGKNKKKISGGSEVKEVDSTARILAPIAPSPETGDFTQAAATSPIGTAQPVDVDPINEADLFLSFGRDAQAEEILTDALEKNPASNPIRLKLLSIYANRNDAKLFSVIARQVQDSGDVAAWAQTAEMGRNLEPNNPMYAGAGEPVIAAPTDQGKDEQQQAAGLDFDLGMGEPATVDNENITEPNAPFSGKSTATQEVDFDLGFDEPTAAAAAENESAATPSKLDFDLGLGEPSLPEESAADVVAGTITKPSESLQAEQETPMDFDISATRLPVAQEEEQPAAIAPDLDDLVFDITTTPPATAAITKEKPATNASGNTDEALEFTLDFPSTTEPTPAQASAREAVDLDLSDISLDIGEPASPAPTAEAKDAHWHDVATKLDLARAYQEMGDNAGAREILEEVLTEGDDQQRATAKGMMQQLLV